MRNPWKDVANLWGSGLQKREFVLAKDRDAIANFNRKADAKTEFHLELLPEPFLGHPNAPIILLNKNPGFGKNDHKFYRMDGVVQAWRKNILHLRQTYPFYLLHPDYQEINGGKWWSKILKPLLRIADRETVAQSICCIEYFPYHSKRFNDRVKNIESQAYSFNLVKESIQNGSVIIIMRGQKLWYKSIEGLERYPLKFVLNSPQNVVVTEGNCPDGFSKIAEILGMASSKHL